MESDEDFRDESHKTAVEQVKQYLLRIMPSGFDLSHFALEKIFVDHGISHVAKLVSAQTPLKLKIGEAGQLYFEEASGKKNPKIDLDPETVQEAIAVFVRSGSIQLGISLSCAIAKLVRSGIVSGDVYKMFSPVRELLPDLKYALPSEVRVAFETVFPYKSVSDDFAAANRLLLERFFKSANVSHAHASLIVAEGEQSEVGLWVEILAQIDVDPIHYVWAGSLGATDGRKWAVHYLDYSLLKAVWSSNAITGLFMACILKDMADAQSAVLPAAFDTCIIQCLTQHFPDEIPPYCRSSVQKMSQLPPALKSKLLGLPAWHAESAGASHPAPSMKPKSSSSTTTTTTTTTTTSSNPHPSPTVSSTGHANQPSTNVAGSTANHSGTVPSTWKSASPSKNKSPSGTTTTTSTPSTTTTTTSTSSTSSSKQPPPKGGSS